MPRVLLTLAIIGIAVYALADLAGARKEETGGLPKLLWAVLIVFVPIVGGVAWIIFRRASGPTAEAPSGRGRQSGGTRREGPLAPDDDPEFLWRLKLEAERERRRREGHDSGDPKP